MIKTFTTKNYMVYGYDNSTGIPWAMAYPASRLCKVDNSNRYVQWRSQDYEMGGVLSID